jgi:rhamnose utilization protein RhaD (predicted bifunctional aldolase and dehydrogenase)/NAD(P)-dependent dehydrogenase (short-subunit alcohol dehydrogenase family)
MQNLWNQDQASKYNNDVLALRVYTSRLLGQEENLVLHGGGNTSVKTEITNLFGEQEQVLYVKGSGWDLATIEKAGFAPVKLNVLQKMAALESLSDSDMVNNQRAAMLDPNAPNPSVEAILHAIIPYKYVDHTHADAVVTITNTPNGKELIETIYGNKVLIIPYIMPGFVLAKKVYELTQNLNWSKLDGMILMNHGVFTFSDDAQESYTKMIDLVSQAENYLADHQVKIVQTTKVQPDLLELAQIRKKVAEIQGNAVVARWDYDDLSVNFANLSNVAEIAVRGPLTPDHVIRTKLAPVILNQEIDDNIDNYVKDYQAYFARNDNGTLTCLNPAPCWAVWQQYGCISFGKTVKEANIIADIKAHTINAIQIAENLNQWQALPEKDIFEVEYWELEQAKLKKNKASLPLQGKIALVTGAASGIGYACVKELLAQGAVVAALDLNSQITELFQTDSVLSLVCDVTDEQQLQNAVDNTVAKFGGLDILISNAGAFFANETIENMSAKNWNTSLNINLTSHQQLLQICTPYLSLGIDPAVVMIASKNVPAPGPGAGAYSVAKAGQTQLARVAALELAPKGIRVNTIHPNAVFDTALWTDEILSKRAKHYGISVEEYKQNNLLKVEVQSKDVALLACSMAGDIFSKTTGSQVAIDGGNERVI